MIQGKTISQLITDQNSIRPGRINIIDAPVSSGKTTFALTTLPEWARSIGKILYLIDTNNGELSIQRNIITASRQTYAFQDYNTKQVWGEADAKEKMPVMTYAGFGRELLTHGGKFHWLRDFEYIICDEMQHLVRYQNYDRGDKTNLIAADMGLRFIMQEMKSRIIALSATPQKIREHYKELCYTVPMDRSDIFRLETFTEIPYSCGIESLLKNRILRMPDLQTGILYTTKIEDMMKIIKFARDNGIRADGFWSIHAKTPMSREQYDLRQTVLGEETIPNYIDLLVINNSSETCIKIKEKNRKVDYVIVHDSEDEVKTQVRGRYHGDLPYLFYHNIKEANMQECRYLPDRFLNVRLYSDGQKELCAYLKLRDPKAAEGEYYKMRKVREYLEGNGYYVDYKKDSKSGGKHYYFITRK